MDIETLKRKAVEASNNSYSPYSKFRVGAALLTKDGKYVQGCNVENASYGLSNCAERTCLFTAYASGLRKDDIVAFALYSPSEQLVSPCGACRQVMSELLNMDTKVYMVYGKECKCEESTVAELLPYTFTKDNLNV